MDPAHLVVQQVTALLAGPVHADPLDRRGVIPGSGRSPASGSPGSGPRRQLGHPLHAALRGDRHDPGDDRAVDPGELAALAEVVEVVVVEEQLGDDVVGSGVDLGLEVVELGEAVGRAGMALGESRRRRCRKPRASGWTPLSLKLLMKRTRSAACWKASWPRSQPARSWRHVAAQRQDVAHPRGGVATQDLPDLVLLVADAGQVRHGGELRLLLDPHHQVVGHLPGRAAGAVGHRDEARA